jgi:hypothetical protein
MIIDGRKIKSEILEDVKKQAKKLSFVPIFCDILVGDDPVSAQYVNMKAKTAESVGIKFHRAEFPATITTDELVEEIRKINSLENMCGPIDGSGDIGGSLTPQIGDPALHHKDQLVCGNEQAIPKKACDLHGARWLFDLGSG